MDGKISAERTNGLHRRYDLAKLKLQSLHCSLDPRKTIAYARVSSCDQKKDLERQKKLKAVEDVTSTSNRIKSK